MVVAPTALLYTPMSFPDRELADTALPGWANRSRAPVDWVSLIGSGPHEAWLHSLPVTVLPWIVAPALTTTTPFCAISGVGPAPVIVLLLMVAVVAAFRRSIPFFW